ncbi:11530_t:CDS:2, partial [Acaulospora morrowiae]
DWLAGLVDLIDDLLSDIWVLLHNSAGKTVLLMKEVCDDGG